MIQAVAIGNSDSSRPGVPRDSGDCLSKLLNNRDYDWDGNEDSNAWYENCIDPSSDPIRRGSQCQCCNQYPWDGTTDSMLVTSWEAYDCVMSQWSKKGTPPSFQGVGVFMNHESTRLPDSTGLAISGGQNELTRSFGVPYLCNHLLETRGRELSLIL
ncbi:hypothetical protein PM082_021469 [Marasmius tenuissimus]|nr:hypothetical protein PM082_021469 [Marasmius tenuissimus]